MTKKEMKERLIFLCRESWETYNRYVDVFGLDSIQASKMRTAWFTYNSLYKEFFCEEVEY